MNSRSMKTCAPGTSLVMWSVAVVGAGGSGSAVTAGSGLAGVRAAGRAGALVEGDTSGDSTTGAGVSRGGAGRAAGAGAGGMSRVK